MLSHPSRNFQNHMGKHHPEFKNTFKQAWLKVESQKYECLFCSHTAAITEMRGHIQSQHSDKGALQCIVPGGCKVIQKGTLRQLHEHFRAHHSQEKITQYRCPSSSCLKREFNTIDDLVQHLKSVESPFDPYRKVRPLAHKSILDQATAMQWFRMLPVPTSPGLAALEQPKPTDPADLGDTEQGGHRDDTGAGYHGQRTASGYEQPAPQAGGTQGGLTGQPTYTEHMHEEPAPLGGLARQATTIGHSQHAPQREQPRYGDDVPAGDPGATQDFEFSSGIHFQRERQRQRQQQQPQYGLGSGTGYQTQQPEMSPEEQQSIASLRSSVLQYQQQHEVRGQLQHTGTDTAAGSHSYQAPRYGEDPSYYQPPPPPQHSVQPTTRHASGTSTQHAPMAAPQPTPALVTNTMQQGYGGYGSSATQYSSAYNTNSPQANPTAVATAQQAYGEYGTPGTQHSSSYYTNLPQANPTAAPTAHQGYGAHGPPPVAPQYGSGYTNNPPPTKPPAQPQGMSLHRQAVTAQAMTRSSSSQSSSSHQSSGRTNPQNPPSRLHTQSPSPNYQQGSSSPDDNMHHSQQVVGSPQPGMGLKPLSPRYTISGCPSNDSTSSYGVCDPMITWAPPTRSPTRSPTPAGPPPAASSQ
ncbi:hypothetical protein QBC35DRAFT_475130 [Podospora australis]|uniref:Uncharacterized protein n=1 Tax=Podospora australis TaxID=1536484 RepID=A0AAN6WR73_9PEZI|nr:hypothetical protein QBC35DRAFT_475130 [Podospora australis]